jgi:hypothetical protein
MDAQLFFVGGAPRSGTTWLQQILDAHSDICCRGEGLFQHDLADPLHALIAQRRQAIERKNLEIFRHTGGYPLPEGEDAEFLLGTAILQALHRQTEGKAYRAVGEKTPENVFLFPRLKALFPAAKFVGIVRDPRDVLASAWHFFRGATAGKDEEAEKTAYVTTAAAVIGDGARNMITLQDRYPGDSMIVTYEALHHTPTAIVSRLFQFLDVPDGDAIVNECLARTAFAAQTGGRMQGEEATRAFHRKGVIGGWEATLTPDMNALVLRELGWMFPRFGWQA